MSKWTMSKAGMDRVVKSLILGSIERTIPVRYGDVLEALRAEGFDHPRMCFDDFIRALSETQIKALALPLLTSMHSKLESLRKGANSILDGIEQLKEAV